MLGGSVQIINIDIAKCLARIIPKKILEFGSGNGKLAYILDAINITPTKLVAVQKLFSENDRNNLLSKGYTDVIDDDISNFLRNGLSEHYDIIAGMDVIEHFFYGEAMSIIDYSLYNCNFFLLVWPSRFPQNLGDPERDGQLKVSNILDVHRTSFELSDISSRFDVVYYNQVSLGTHSRTMRLHIALIRGHMNFEPLCPQVGNIGS